MEAAPRACLISASTTSGTPAPPEWRTRWATTVRLARTLALWHYWCSARNAHLLLGKGGYTLTIRHTFWLLTVASVAAAVMGLTGTALADPSLDSGNPSCFGYTSRSEPGEPGPGAGVHTFTTSATGSHGTNLVDDAAKEVGPVQHVRNDVCPTSSFP